MQPTELNVASIGRCDWKLMEKEFCEAQIKSDLEK